MGGQKREENRIALALMLAVGILACALMSGCAGMFTARTMITVERNGCKATYESNKEQQGLEGEVCGGKLSVGRSGTPEAAMIAALQAQMQVLELLKMLTGMANKATIP